MKKCIAITGGIGSGKSSVLRFLGERGYPVFSCDEIYREIILSPDYIQKIAVNFPKCIINGNIDRKLLAEVVFKNSEKLALLNGIAHPLIMDRLFEKMHACAEETVFAEVPLLFEGHYEKRFDAVIVVLRHKADRVRSIMMRDGITEKEALRRISMQFDYDNGKMRFDKSNAILIENNGSISDLNLKINALTF